MNLKQSTMRPLEDNMVETCVFCNGEGVMGTLKCTECRGTGRIVHQQPKKVAIIPDSILNKDVSDKFQPENLPDPTIVELDQHGRMPEGIQEFVQPGLTIKAPIVASEFFSKQQKAITQPSNNDTKICMKIYMELISKIHGEKNKIIVSEVFKKYLDL